MEKLCQCSISIIQIACCNNLAVFSLKLKSSPLCCKFVYFDPLAPSPKNNKVIKTCIIGFFFPFWSCWEGYCLFFLFKSLLDYSRGVAWWHSSPFVWVWGDWTQGNDCGWQTNSLNLYWKGFSFCKDWTPSWDGSAAK